MYEKIAIAFVALWLLALVSSYTLIGFAHILLVIAIAVFMSGNLMRQRLPSTLPDPSLPPPGPASFPGGR